MSHLNAQTQLRERVQQMAARRVCMRQVREVFQLHFLGRKSQSEIARHLGIGKTTVREYLQRLSKSKLSDWSSIKALDEASLERELGFTAIGSRKPESVMPDWNLVHREMSRRHVTLSLLWNEYRSIHGESAYGYTQFCEHYNRWCDKLSVVMRQSHKAGEKTFIDYSGDGLKLVNPKTGEIKDLELFVAVLGASSYTYAEVTETQTSRDWISSHARMSEFFGGTTEIWVPDNLKAGVIKASRYEPVLNETYRECGRHYGACIIPARSMKPRDKAKVEAGVLVAQRWILGRLRDGLFTSVCAANEAIAECLEIINNRTMKHLNKSRRDLYLELDRPKLKALPRARFEYAEWKKATVNIDYHIALDHHHYSCPYQLVKQTLDVRATATVVEIFSKGNRVASHRRSNKRGGYTTSQEHMPKSHREHHEWTPERVVRWSQEIGPNTGLLVKKILETKVHPQQGFAAALGIIRLEKKYGKGRVDRACARAIEVGAQTYRFVNEMLKNKMEGVNDEYNQDPIEDQYYAETNETQLTLLGAENIRGSDYYK